MDQGTYRTSTEGLHMWAEHTKIPLMKLQYDNLICWIFTTFTVNYRYNNLEYTSLAMLILAWLVSDSLTPSKLRCFADLSR